MKVFISGTFRHDWNKEFNPRLAQALEERGIKVFLPQRDSEQSGDRKQTFADDVAGVRSADAIVAVGIHSQTANWGFELGVAYERNMPIVILVREDEEVHLMIEGAATVIKRVSDPEDFDSYLSEVLSAFKRDD